jgi:hypothetical protein
MFSATVDRQDINEFLHNDVIQITIGDTNRPAVSILQTFILMVNEFLLF